MEIRFAVWSWRLGAAFLLPSFLLTSLIWAKGRLDEEQNFRNELRSARIELPANVPEISQESVDRALEIFSIHIPEGVEHPKLDTELKDRGITIREAWGSRTRILVGPAAFSSWAILGSTLAHEIEVHAQQHFFIISMLDMLGLDGTARAERIAYKHELHYHQRFGMSSIEYELIRDTMNYYYPEDGSSPIHEGKSPSLAARFRTWVVELLATEDEIY